MSPIKGREDVAIEFINSIRVMTPELARELINREAGEELAKFFLNYTQNLIAKEPDRVTENASALMLMGYLIRRNEERLRSGSGLQSYAFI